MAKSKGKGGKGGKSGRGSSAQQKRDGDRPAADRIEEEARDWSERLARSLARSAARAREELEDIWAEAQNIRRGR
jgi:hypothetical protein